MQIYGLLVLASPPGAGAVPLTTAWELGSFSWLQRGTVQDMMGFMARVSIPHPFSRDPLTRVILTDTMFLFISMCVTSWHT